MDSVLADVAAPAPARARLVTRPLLIRFVSVIGTATSFYLLLSAVPLYARSAGAGTGLAGLASLPWLPGAGPATRATKADGMLAALRNPALVRPAALFSATTMAVGIIVTFLPLAVAHADANVAALALLVQPAAAIAGRWLAGRRGDRHSNRPSSQHSDHKHSSATLLVPGVLTAAAGVLVLSLTAVSAAVIAGAAVFGLGFGVTQNVTQTVMYDRVPESAYGASSALWNLAYDGGMGLGAAGFGVLALHTGYPVAFVLVAAVLVVAVLPAVLAAVARARAAGRSDLSKAP
jgi:predicted MFS family arabinose efflux permease